MPLDIRVKIQTPVNSYTITKRKEKLTCFNDQKLLLNIFYREIKYGKISKIRADGKAARKKSVG
jgi:hypothetical protein